MQIINLHNQGFRIRSWAMAGLGRLSRWLKQELAAGQRIHDQLELGREREYLNHHVLVLGPRSMF